MIFLTNLTSLVMACIVFYSLPSFSVVLSEVPKVDSQVQTKSPVWQIGNSFGKGVGFFVAPNRFITAFDTAAVMFTGDNINFIVVSQNGNSRIKVKRLLALDAYGLALFETESLGNALNIKEDLPDFEEDLLVPAYSDDGLIEAKKTGNTFFSESGLYSFAVDKSSSSVKEARGSPVLNKQGDIMGVVLKGMPNAMLTLRSSYLREFIAGNRGLDCSGSNNFMSCIRKAMNHLKKQAYGGHAVSQFLLSLMYFRAVDEKETHWWLEWDKKPAQSGKIVFVGDRQLKSIEAPKSLIQRNNMKMWPSPSDIEKEALELASSAAEQGLPEAQFYLAIQFYLQKDPIQSLPGIFFLVSEAAKQGFHMAHVQKALMYLTGYGTEKNAQKAVEELNKAADQNVIPALLKLAFLYGGGEGVERDSQKIVEYTRRAADLGSPIAEYQLAEMHLMGRGVEKDFKKSLELFTRSANKGHHPAQYQLGIMYHQGKGVKRNPLQAYNWINQAAKNGYTQAQHFLKNERKPCPSVWN